MAQFSPPPPISASDSHGKEGNIKFLKVEHVELNRLGRERPIKRNVYFHQQVIKENQPDWNNQIQHQHWSLPMTYEYVNSWERDVNHPIPKLSRLPDQVRYAESFDVPASDRVPVMKMTIYDTPIPGIDLEDDQQWLEEWLGVKISLDYIHPGRTGLFYEGKIIQAKKSYYFKDLQRLNTAPRSNTEPFDKKVCVKLYITYQMTRQDQMDRLYEETLAHCELKHPNIVDTYSVKYQVRQAHPNAQGMINAIDGMTDLHSYIIMEYSKLGSMNMLLEKIVNENLGFDYYHLYLQDIISGLLYLHSTGRAHREINQTNFLAVQAQRGFNFKEDRLANIRNPTAANCVIKICDFAYTKKFDQHQQVMMRGWQSMDAMDLGRNILWHCFNYIQKVDGNQHLLPDLVRMSKFLTVDDTKKRLDNLQSLKMKEGVDKGKNVRAFMDKKVAGGRGKV